MAVSQRWGYSAVLYLHFKKNGWMSFSKRPGHDALCYTKPIDSLKDWNDRFFWVDAFACPAIFPCHTGKSIPKDPFPKSSEFNAKHYASLVAYPAPFHKYLEPFLCLIGLSRYYTLDENTYPEFLREDNDQEMDLLSFICTVDPSKVRIAERQRGDDEPKLLETTVGRVVLLLPVAPARDESELEDSVDRLFDEGGSGEQADQGDYVGGVNIQPASEAADTTVKDVAPLQPKRNRKRKAVVVDAGEASHPPKILRKDHGAPSGVSMGGKSTSAIRRLLAGAVLNPKVGIAAFPTLPFVTSSVSATPEREGRDHTDSAEVDSLTRSSAPVMSTTTTVTATVTAATVLKETVVKPSLFATESSSAGGTEPTPGGFSDLSGTGLLVGDIRTVTDPDSDLQKVYVPRWNGTNGLHLDDNRDCREMLFAEFNVGAARQMALSAEVRIRAKYNIREKRKLKSVVVDQTEALKVKEKEIEALKARLLLMEAEAIRLRAEERNAALEEEKSVLDVRVADLAATVRVREQEAADSDAMVNSVKLQNDRLVDQVHELETSSAQLREKVAVYENCMSQLERFQDERMKEVSDKFDKLDVDIVEMALHLEERAIEKGMQDGLAAGITHGQEGRVLSDVAAFNPSVKSDYTSALQDLQDVNFSLIVELESHKDASIKTLMNILRLEEPLAETVVGATSLSFSLDVSRNRVQKIWDNIAQHRSALRDVFVSTVEPLSPVALGGTEGASGTVPETTMALSITFAPTSSIPSISTDNYEIVHADGRGGEGAEDQATVGNVEGNVDPFPTVDDVDLNIQ
ncbi:hypothetical protein Tco_1374131 [Tanacetum coccineum]